MRERTEVWSDDIYHYQLSAYKALCNVHVQLSLFALLADCMIPLYCRLAFSVKNKQSTDSWIRTGSGFLHPITSQKGTHFGTPIFTLMLIVTTVLLFYKRSFSLMLLLNYICYICYFLCIVKLYFIYDIFPDDSSLVPRQRYFIVRGRLAVLHSLSEGTIHLSIQGIFGSPAQMPDKSLLMRGFK